MLALYLHCGLLILMYTSGWFIYSVIKKRNDVADIAWGLGFIVICGYLFFSSNHTTLLATIVYCLVGIWGFRLSVHIYARNRNKPEDFRYRQMRNQWNSSELLQTYCKVFLLQGLLMLIIASPLLMVSLVTIEVWNPFAFFGIFIWLIGFIFQSVGDWQLQKFCRSKKHGEIMQSGLWKYTRHPNYFGEIAMWWGIFFMVISSLDSWYIIIGPITITYLLVYVSGVPLMEKKYHGNPIYEFYKKRTPMLIPWFPKK